MLNPGPGCPGSRTPPPSGRTVGLLAGKGRWVQLGPAEKHCTKVTISDKMTQPCTLPLIPMKTVRPKQTKKTMNTRTKWRLESVYSRMGASLQGRSQWVRGRQGDGSVHTRLLPTPAAPRPRARAALPPGSPHLRCGPTLKPGAPPDKTVSMTSVTTAGSGWHSAHLGSSTLCRGPLHPRLQRASQTPPHRRKRCSHAP